MGVSYRILGITPRCCRFAFHKTSEPNSQNRAARLPRFAGDAASLTSPFKLIGVLYLECNPKGELLVSAAYWTTGFRVVGLRIQGLAYRVSSLQDSVFNSVFKVGCLHEA